MIAATPGSTGRSRFILLCDIEVDDGHVAIRVVDDVDYYMMEDARGNFSLLCRPEGSDESPNWPLPNDEQMTESVKSRMTGRDVPIPPSGALPPPGATIESGDRADKRCIEAATEVMAQRMVGLVLFKDMEAAIDAYLASAAKHGWKLK